MKTRQEHILRALANDVRVLSMRQVARTWWADTRWGRSRAETAMKELESGGWLRIHRSLARPVRELNGPLMSWRPGDDAPDARRAARLLHRRSLRDATMTTFVFAGPRSVALFGEGRAPSVKLTHATHDLQVAEVYLHYRGRGSPARRWISEDRLPPDWPLRERPDAVLADDAGRIRRALEYGGDYPPGRLAELHRAFSSIGLSYEIW
jgi:hypothetical protein